MPRQAMVSIRNGKQPMRSGRISPATRKLTAPDRVMLAQFSVVVRRSASACRRIASSGRPPRPAGTSRTGRGARPWRRSSPAYRAAWSATSAPPPAATPGSVPRSGLRQPLLAALDVRNFHRGSATKPSVADAAPRPHATVTIRRSPRRQFSCGGGRRVNYGRCRASPDRTFADIPPSNRVFELVPGRHPRKQLRTLKSQAGY